jgi:uncharacterized membrane protein
VKLLILLAVLVAAAWFAPAPVSHVEGDIEISAPRDRVWSILSDVSGARLWDARMRDVTLVSEAKTGVGTERASHGPIVKTREKVTEWVPYNSLAFEVVHDPRLTRFETSKIEITPVGANGTRVRWSLDYQMNGGYLGNLADRFLLASTHQGRIDDGLPRLKRYAETGEVLP